MNTDFGDLLKNEENFLGLTLKINKFYEKNKTRVKRVFKSIP